MTKVITVDELIRNLRELSKQGCGEMPVVVAEIGERRGIVSVQKETITTGSYKNPSEKDVVCLYRF